MIKTQEKVIGGHTYAVTQLPAMKGARMLVRLGRSLAPALAQLSGAAKSGLSVAGLDISALGGAVKTLFENLSEDEFESITKSLLETATVDRKILLPQLDIVFQGKIDELLLVLAFALEVNYGTFSDALRKLLPAVTESDTDLEISISPPA